MDIFCLEGNWDSTHLESKESLLPLMELLSSTADIDYVRRDVATRTELEYYLERWADRRHRWFEFGYFAFHGEKGKAILLDDGGLTLTRLGTLLAKHGAGKDCIVHIASCYGVLVTDKQLEGFLDKTGALAVCGYTEPVDTLKAAGFELLLLNGLLGNWTYVGTRFRRILKDLAPLATSLGFRYQFSCPAAPAARDG